MRSIRSPRGFPIVLAFVSTGLLGGCATPRDAGAAAGPTFVETFEIVSPDDLTTLLEYKVRNLAEIDPRTPLADPRANQTLSLFGREDLIAATSDDYPTECEALPGALDPLDEIARRAERTSIVIVNESHERTRHRGFIARIAGRLRPLGYDTLAIEALNNTLPGTLEQFLPSTVTRPDQPFFEDGDGYYLSEAAFGRLGRRAKALEYRFLPYEHIDKEPLPDDASREMRIAVREEGQARNIVAFLRDNPQAKLLIHVGYSHATEVPRADGAKWMATRVKAKTGIDPLTISQTTCRGGGDAVQLAKLPSSELPETFDLVVDHPEATFVHGRPEWRMEAGDRPVDIPQSLRPTSGWRIVEARPAEEPTSAVPMDRVAIRPGDDIALMLPPGRYKLRAVDVPYAEPSPSASDD